jgi:hypothetical protein
MYRIRPNIDCTKKFIRLLPSFEKGMNLILKDLESVFSVKVNRETITEGYALFEQWMTRLLEISQPGKEIVALHFGLFETEYNVQLYACGSKTWDGEDPDWACEPAWFPEGSYPDIPLYRNLHRVLKEDTWLGVHLAVSISALYVIRFAREHGSLLLGGRGSRMLATGFDEGDLYHIARLAPEGLKTPEFS